jgi:hypothetical protein
MDSFLFAERRNLVSARVPSHLNWPVLLADHFVPKSATETNIDFFYTAKTAMFFRKPEQNGRETWTEKERPEDERFLAFEKTCGPNRWRNAGGGRGGILIKGTILERKEVE